MGSQKMIEIYGTEGNDLFQDGTNADESYYGLGGNDLIYGSAGNDYMDGGEGRDTLRFVMEDFAGTTGPVSYVLGGGNFFDSAGRINTDFAGIETFEFLSFNPEMVTFDASSFVPTGFDSRYYQLIVRMFEANSTITGSAYNDFFQVRGENHTIEGGDGFDAVRIDQVEEGGTVTISTTNGVTTVSQWMGYDAQLASLTNVETVGVLGTVNSWSHLLVDASASQIGVRFYDGAGDDTFIGGSATDIFFKSGGTVGFDGYDYFTGGGGSDIYVFAPEASWLDYTFITDFSAEDIIDLSFFSQYNSVFVGNAEFSGTGSEIRYEIVGYETWIQVDQDGDGFSDGTIRLTNGAFGIEERAGSVPLQLVIGAIVDDGTDDYFTITDVNDSGNVIFLDGGSGYDTVDATAVAVAPERLIFRASTFDGENTDAIDVAGYRLLGVDQIFGSLNGSNSFFLPNYDRSVELVGGDYSDSFFGSYENADTYFGRGGDDFMYVGAGDTAYGEGGNDTFDIFPRYGEDADAFIYGGDGVDTLRTTFGMFVDLEFNAAYAMTPRGHYTYVEGVENVIVQTASGFESVVIGTDAANRFEVDPNRDEGIDGVLFDGRGGDDSLFGSVGNDELLGGAGNDLIEGRRGNDRIQGNAGDDRLFGNNGDDTLSGGLGNDELSGGNGNDALFGNDGADLLIGNYGSDRLNGGAGNDNLYGGYDNDQLFGSDGRDVLYGGEGNDILNGGQGTDVLNGGIGNDGLYGGLGIDFLYGGRGDDVLRGNEADDYLDGEIGNDTLRADDGNDTLIGGAGNDDLDGGEGSDVLRGGDGNDTLAGGNGNDNLGGGYGDDGLFGGAGDDLIVGGNGADILRGGTGDDRLFGGYGADNLAGGAGTDRLSGGGGSDVFVFGSAGDLGVSLALADVITDFSRSAGDLINLAAVDADTTTSGNQGFAFIGDAAFTGTAGELRYVQSNGQTVIEMDRNGDGAADLFLKLDGMIDLTINDFAF